MKNERQKKEGVFFTPQRLASFVAQKLLDSHPIRNNCQELNILDPAIGDGELIISFLQLIPNIHNIKVTVVGFDINADNLDTSKKRISHLFPGVLLNLMEKDYLEAVLDNEDLFKETKIEPKYFDYIIANPPYIRTQLLGSVVARKISQNWHLRGRFDLYQAFMLAVGNQMNEKSVAAFITSNRFLSTEGCKDFRERINRLYSFQRVWDFGDTGLFKAAVLPLVSIFTTKQELTTPPSFSTVYKVNTKDVSYENSKQVMDPVEAIETPGITHDETDNYLTKHGILSISTPTAPWTMQNEKSERWLSIVRKNTACFFKDVGKIRVGVKTTADNVFIHNDWLEETGCEPELLLPLITHDVAAPFKRISHIKKQILYPHYSQGGKRKVYDIESYPVSYHYLLKFKEQLEKRKYLINAGRMWYEIWVPQDSQLWSQEKIVFRDISEHPAFWIEKGKAVVNGDCYWMVADSTNYPTDILWLVLAVANSQFIEDYYDCCFNNKLYANKRRYISQYVENFPLPQYDTELAHRIIHASQEAYQQGFSLERKIQIDSLVKQAFGVE